MKTSINALSKVLFVALTVFLAQPALSQNEYNSEKTFAVGMYPAKAESKLWLCLEQYKFDEKIDLELVNQKGEVLFREKIAGKAGKRNAYRQSFDMSQLRDGNYTFRLSTASQKEEMTFKLSTPSLKETLPVRLIAIN